ncbi:MAG: hypothetical protein RI973_1446 [Bacteroidota bacterium]|jgi:cytochrome P450 PksS
MRSACRFAGKKSLKTNIVMNLISKLSGWLKSTRQTDAEVLFVFGANDNFAAKTATAYYQSEPAFRESIVLTDLLIKAQGHGSILPFFEANADIASVSVPFAGMATQLALWDLCRSKGTGPAAVLGIGLGEIPAICAAGAISRESAVRLFSGFLQAARQSAAQAFLFLPKLKVSSLLADLPCKVYLAADLGPQGLVVLCSEEDVEKLGNYFRHKKIDWQRCRQEGGLPYHTPLLGSRRAYLWEAMEGVVPAPVTCDYYSCALGQKVPSQSLLPHFLAEDLLGAPINLNKAMAEVVARTWKAVVHCYAGIPMAGAPKDEVIEALKQSAGPHLFLEEQPAGKLPEEALQRLKGGQQAKPVKPPEDRYQQFLNHFDILVPAAAGSLQAAYPFLRQFGDIHYLPKSNTWLVLSYELVNQVMQDHQTFSNRMYSEREPCLIGADPPDHTSIRSLVQPHFAPKGIQKAADEADAEVARCLEKLSQQSGFDVVCDFSVPIVQAAVGRFLGLDEASFQALKAVMPRDIYENDIMAIANEYFMWHMNNPDATSNQGGMKHYLLRAVEAGSIDMKVAISLMTLFWDAGIITSSLHLTNLVYELLTRPDIAGKLREDPELVSDFIGECLRLNPPGVQVMRVSKKDTVLGGMSIPAGSMVAIGMQSANRDPAVFSRADEMVFNRPTRRDFVFGGGIHFCPGHHLAKREAEAVVNGVLPLLDQLELDPVRPLRRLYKLGFSGMASLPLRWKK